MREPVYDELVRELFATFRFDAAEAQDDVGHTRIYFRLGGELRTCSVMEFGWRLGLYDHSETTQGEFMLRLQNGETMKNDFECAQFWPTIGEGDYTPTTRASQIRDPRVRLTHRCLTFSLSGRHSSQHRVTSLDLFFLYTIHNPGVYCNIPYWVAILLKHGAGTRETDRICGGMFVTRLARSYGILRPEIMDYLSSSSCRTVKSKSLRQMDVVTELAGGLWTWYVPGGHEEEDDDDEDEEDGQQPGQEHGGYEVGSDDYYRNMSRGDWQAHQGAWMGQVDSWRTTTDQRFDWMYDHTIRQMQHLSTRDQLEPHLQIDPFPGREPDYPPYGYFGHLPSGYEYRGPSPPQ